MLQIHKVIGSGRRADIFLVLHTF